MTLTPNKALLDVSANKRNVSRDLRGQKKPIQQQQPTTMNVTVLDTILWHGPRTAKLLAVGNSSRQIRVSPERSVFPAVMVL
jgi:hypothetical protein